MDPEVKGKFACVFFLHTLIQYLKAADDIIAQKRGSHRNISQSLHPFTLALEAWKEGGMSW